ncbi:MAG: hypothetical protein EA421_12550 [Gemmatimonadales bacterium]|nr:MAG: hypothetical protein EA421_12550 [Gemmatimonadales bacterium]
MTRRRTRRRATMTTTDSPTCWKCHAKSQPALSRDVPAKAGAIRSAMALRPGRNWATAHAIRRR